MTPDDDDARWLEDTPALNYSHPTIRALATRLTLGCTDLRRKAMLCHDHVRSLPFYICTQTEGMDAPQVVECGCGDGATKATLLTALLRAVGVPARIRVATRSGDVLHGLFDTRLVLFEHFCVEARLGGAWLGMDTHVVDEAFARAALEHLGWEERRLGYAVDSRGTLAWNGRESAFGQATRHGWEDPSAIDRGIFHDMAGYAAAHPSVCGLRGFASEKAWQRAAASANLRILELRTERFG